jgi:hypothetical protein
VATVSCLPDFLIARIAEDEAEVESRIVGELESLHRDGMLHVTRADLLTTKREAGVIQYDASWLTRPLAECEAKRFVINALRGYEPSDQWGTEMDMGKRENYAAGALRRMALVYADHPDYREEWRP